jgi:hypothetical protein
VVGRLADKRPREGKLLEGLLVRQGGQNDLLMAARDLPTFTKLHPGRITQRQALLLRQPFSEVREMPISLRVRAFFLGSMQGEGYRDLWCHK